MVLLCPKTIACFTDSSNITKYISSSALHIDSEEVILFGRFVLHVYKDYSGLHSRMTMSQIVSENIKSAGNRKYITFSESYLL